MIESSLIKLAYERICDYVSKTPFIESVILSRMTGANVYLKCENFQITGSFKIRGAANKLLTYHEVPKKVIVASTGNHGKAVAYICSKLKIHAQIYVPKEVSVIKKQGMQAYGAEIIEISGTSLDAETFAQHQAAIQNIPLIHPYDDVHVITGQGTIAVEMEMQAEIPDVVFIAVGGGGLLSGIASYLKTLKPSIEIVACLPENSSAMKDSLDAGKVVESAELPTLSDGTAGGVGLNSVTYSLCKKLIDSIILVSEEEITQAIKLILETEQMIIEGAAGVAVAGFLKSFSKYQAKKVAIILCGRNIDYGLIKKII